MIERWAKKSVLLFVLVKNCLHCKFKRSFLGREMLPRPGSSVEPFENNLKESSPIKELLQLPLRARVWWPTRVLEDDIILALFLLHQKILQFDCLRAVVFQLNLKYLHVKITNLLRVVVLTNSSII